MTNAPSLRCAVLGDPIAHSLSPQIHTLFGEQTGIRVHYEKQQVTTAQLNNTLLQLQTSGYDGCNITVPHKQSAYQYACNHQAHCTVFARRAQAINTMAFTPQDIHADNTDGQGLVNDIQNRLGRQIQNQNVLILGSGGATRGIIAPLLQCQPARLRIAARNIQAMDIIGQQFSIETILMSELLPEAVDILINATSSSLHNQLPPISEHVVYEQTLAYDLMYSKYPTAFERWAQTCGTQQTSNGLGMLIEQAALAFRLWTDKTVNTQAVFDHLKP